MNMNNFGVLRGRLVADPAVFPNKDGSSKVKFSIAAENNYKNKETGKRDVQVIPVEAFTKDYAASPYTKVHKGDKVSVEISLRQNNYTDKNGEKVYDTIQFVESIQFEESKSVTEARAAARVAESNDAPVEPAPVPAAADAQA